MTDEHRDFVWECDYGERNSVFNALAGLIETQSQDELGMCTLFINNNPYNLEFFVVLGYENPKEDQILFMKSKIQSTGSRYRPDITMAELISEQMRKRFNGIAITGSEDIRIAATSDKFFLFPERFEMATRVSMRPLGKKLPVFISYSSYDKPIVEDLIPYLNRAGLPVWYDRISIDYGESIISAIQNGIQASGAVVFYITERFLESRWCRIEMESFISRYTGGGDVLILSVVDASVDHVKLPLFLQTIKYLRLRNGYSIDDIAKELIPVLKKHFKL